MPRLCLLLLLSSTLAGCIPAHSASLSLPVVATDGADRERAIVAVDLGELALRLDDFDAQRLAFYVDNRHPRPYRLVDGDGDGAFDAVHVAMPVRGDGTTRLLVVCPGPAADGDPPAGEAVPECTPDFTRSRG